MKIYTFLFLNFLGFYSFSISAQEDPYEIGWTAINRLQPNNTIESCLKKNIYNVDHLWIRDEAEFQQLLTHFDKFKNIDSLTIGTNWLCAVINQLETKMFEEADRIPVFPQLKYLSINVFSMEKPFKNLAQFKTLEHLELVGAFTEIPESVWELKKLQVLNLYGYFKTVSSKVHEMSNLKALILQGKYNTLPKHNTLKTKLLYLNLSGTFTKIPEIVNLCPNLRFLEMSSNNPWHLDDKIGNLKQLELLILTNNVLLSISDRIAELQKLEDIHLSCVWLSSLPESICKLKKLRELRLDVMCLDEELEDYYGSKYKDIPVLKIPENIYLLESIEWIDLTGRKVSETDIQHLLDVFPNADIEYGEWE